MSASNALPNSRLLQRTEIIHSRVHLHIPQSEAERLLRLLTSGEREKRFPATLAALRILHPEH
jgi:hypothetical protein